MARVLASLRRHLDLMPSPLPDTPGLVIRDPLRFAEGIVVLPPPLVPCLLLFDGDHDEADLGALLARITRDGDVGALARHLIGTLSASGFLEDQAFRRLRDERRHAFAGADTREPAHAGSAYPDDPAALAAWAARCLADGPSSLPPREPMVGIAAPHVSPEGGWRSYASAYGALTADVAARTFVILGTSHYGAPGRFGLTRKPFSTPLGTTTVDRPRLDALAAAGGPAVVLEDYCHAVEHSIEFQVLFLQQLFGATVRILPVLCGPLGGGAGREAPRDDEEVQRFLGALAEVAAPADEVFWILGIDMAHVGRRYGDRDAAVADTGPLVGVAAEDEARCRLVEAADAEGFWARVEPDGAGDPLRWCGSSAVYAFLKAARPVRGRLLAYEQWNIDDQSVVSFAGMTFHR